MCFRFLPNNETAAELRGGPIWRADRKTLRRHPEAGNGHKIHINIPPPGENSGIIAQIWPCETWYILMPGRVAMAEILERRPFDALVVDYHADVLNLADGDHSPESTRAGRSVPDTAWQWWAQPEPQEAIRRALAAADVITTPWPELIPALKQFTHRIVYLPDSKPGKLEPFREAWTDNVIPAIIEATTERRRSR